MVKKPDSNKARIKRHNRVRNKISGTPERPRLNVFRSAKHIYFLLYTSMKRIRPRAQGRAFSVLKRSSHITLVLKEKE